METRAYPNDPRDRDADTEVRSEIEERAPPPLHPRSTGTSPHPGYTGELRGTPPDLDASFDDAPGPIAPHPGRPLTAERIDVAFYPEDPGELHAPGEPDLPGEDYAPGRPYPPGEPDLPGEDHAPGGRYPPGEPDLPGEDHAPGGRYPPGEPDLPGEDHAPGGRHPPGDPDLPGEDHAPGGRYPPGDPDLPGEDHAPGGRYPPGDPDLPGEDHSPGGRYPLGELGAVIGTDSADRLDGDEQSDVMIGLAGDHLMYGHGGNDELRGEDGDEDLHGEDGADVLIGGPGNDSLIGREGTDIFAFMLPAEEDGSVWQFGDDVIHDLNLAEGDSLDFCRVHDHFPGLSASMRPTENGDIVVAFTQADGAPVGNVTLHRSAYQEVGGFPDPGMPHELPHEFGDPGTPYAPPHEFPACAAHPEHPFHSHNPVIPDDLPPGVALHAEPLEADAM